jgi:addiction module RelE/StbE family toxin
LKLRWTARANAQLARLIDRIGLDDPRAADRMDERVVRKATLLIDNPYLGRRGRRDGTRELVAHPSYLLIYDVRGDTVRILRVLHTARRWPPVRG